ncbi:MAG: hypothetical protein CMJ32_06140 [Phycisphaerae bacterium]|nr:hypothetical protein [Phycisphaerae bacterium]
MVMLICIPALFLMLSIMTELLHARRVRRIGRLAFGRTGRPRGWTRITPLVRCASVVLLSWGFLVLAEHKPRGRSIDPEKEPSQHLLVCLDVSPSMYIEDAGPGGRESRSMRASEVLRGILSRLDMNETRVTVVAFYTSALPIVVDTYDINIIENVLNGLPMEHAFEVGQTRMQEGVEASLEFARPWPPDSAALIVVSDGDTISESMIQSMPRSISDAIVIGVGNPHKGTTIAGRSSRQDEASLKRLAVRLNGIYHDANTKHLPSSILSGLSMIIMNPEEADLLKRLALISILVGGCLLAATGPALVMLGMPAADLVRKKNGPMAEVDL